MHHTDDTVRRGKGNGERSGLGQPLRVLHILLAYVCSVLVDVTRYNKANMDGEVNEGRRKAGVQGGGVGKGAEGAQNSADSTAKWKGTGQVLPFTGGFTKYAELVEARGFGGLIFKSS